MSTIKPNGTRMLRDVKLPTILMKINVFFVSLDIIYNASGVCLVVVTFTRTLHHCIVYSIYIIRLRVYVYCVMCSFFLPSFLPFCAVFFNKLFAFMSWTITHNNNNKFDKCELSVCGVKHFFYKWRIIYFGRFDRNISPNR